MSTIKPIITVIYSSGRKSGAYLYVTLDQRTEPVPEPLLQQLGQLREVMTLKLTSARKLAQADVEKVMKALLSQGYYLQLPPAVEPVSMNDFTSSGE